MNQVVDGVRVACLSESQVVIQFGELPVSVMPRLVCSPEPGPLPAEIELHHSVDATKIQWVIEPESRIFGLGAAFGNLDRRGRYLELYPHQTVPQTDGAPTNNSAHPFWVIRDSKGAKGVFISHAGKLEVDLGHTSRGTIRATFAGPAQIVLFSGKSVLDVIQQYHRLLGAFWQPPRWAFGYHQCRYSYTSAEEVNSIAQRFAELKLPCDALYLDIHYMDRYKIFTFDPQHFSDVEKMVGQCKALGIHLVPIIDPGVRVESGYKVYEEGKVREAFCRNLQGEVYQTTVWPGRVVLPDLFSEHGRKWWIEQVLDFTERYGFTGYWLDMNEPETFFHPERVVAKLRDFESLQCQDYTAEQLFSHWGELQALFNDQAEHQKFTHSLKGTHEPVAHAELHSFYCVAMAEATREAVGEDFFLISRATAPGIQSYAGSWLGDNYSSWEQLHLHITQMLSMNLCGQMYCGADIGGHCGETNHELFVRWMQLGAMSPLFRNHTVLRSRRQEPWSFGEDILAINRNTLNVRSRLLTYLWSEFLHAVSNASPFIAPLGLYYDSNRAWEVEDQFFLGRGLLCAPILAPGARGRTVYLPGDTSWLLWRVSDAADISLCRVEPGTHYIECGLEQMLFFIRPDSVVVLNEICLSSSKLEAAQYDCLANAVAPFEDNLYLDSGKVCVIRRGGNGEWSVSAEDEIVWKVVTEEVT